MKKIILNFILMFFALSLLAQETTDNTLLRKHNKIGLATFLKLGVCQAFFDYSEGQYPPYYRNPAIWRPTTSIGLQIPLHRNIALRPELTYAAKQFNFVVAQYENYEYYYYYTSKSLRVNHLMATLPVIGRIAIGNTSVYIGGGPYYSIALAGGNMRTNYYGYPNIKVDTEATKEHLKDRDYGLSAVAGTSLRLGKISLGMELNYQHGFVNNYGEYDKYYHPNRKRYARTVGVSFLIGTARL